MPVLLSSNNAITTLAAPLASSATTASLAAGTGALFPIPVTNQGFKMTFRDALTGLVIEIALVTGMSGDTITSMLRGQEGTTPQNYIAGDFAGNFNTAGTMQALRQNYTQINGLTGSLTLTTPNLELFLNATGGAIAQPVPLGSSFASSTIPIRFKFWKIDSSGNAVTLTLSGSDTFLGPVSPDNSFPLETQGSCLEIEYNPTLGKWLIL